MGRVRWPRGGTESLEPEIPSEKLLLVYKDNYSYLQQDRVVLNSKTVVSVTKVQPLGRAEIQQVLVTETTLFGAALTASIDSLDVFMQKLESWPRLYVLSARVADS